MIIKCAWCGKYMGEKPPYEDKSVTHSICEDCLKKYFPKVGGERMEKERRLGEPRTEAERAIAHYGITYAEYYAYPERYPLPGRGYGLETGTAAGLSSVEVGRIAEEAAVKASELTGTKIAEHVAKEMSGEMLHQSPISPHCEGVLETPPKCFDFRGIRSWVLCRSWDIMERQKRTRLPVGEAWAEARGVCVRE